MEPSNADIEAGCQGTMRAEVRTFGKRAHSARAWMGDNAIHGWPVCWSGCVRTSRAGSTSTGWSTARA